MARPPPQIIATLKAKRNDIEASIKLYEQKAEQARRDLAHVNTTLAIFATNDPPTCEPTPTRPGCSAAARYGRSVSRR